ncbi:unannotated protein [freshwater metagenome]|uniref:Unannotated protein n=1 Tax=freshwater metagenome TaxID=449393 RepID=A0A6J5YFG4_9ZZZZ
MTASTSSSSKAGARTCTATAAALSCAVTGLTNGVVYWFTAVANVSSTLASGDSVAKSQAPAGVPSAPSAVTATAGDTQISVTWTASTDNGSAIRYYRALARDASGNSKSCGSATASQTSCTITGLTNGVAYTVTVVATNAVGSSAAGSASAAVTPASPPGTPIISSAAAGAGSAVLTWVAPSNGGSAITGYTVTPYIGTTAQTTFACGSANTCTVTGLTSGIAYTFTVKAMNAVGDGAASIASSSVIPILAPPDAPVITQITVKSQTEVLVSWTAPSANGGVISGYTVTAVGGSSAVTPCTTTGALSCTMTGLRSGTSYTFSVTATNAAGIGSAGTMIATAGLEFAPASSNGVSFAAKTLKLDPVLGVATGITLMTIQILESTSAVFPVFIKLKSMSNWSVSLLPSVASKPITPTAGSSMPAPTELTVIAGKNSVALSWLSSTGSSTSQKYLVKDSTNTFFCLTSTPNCMITGLTAGTTYSFTVTPVVEAAGNDVAYSSGTTSSSVSATPSLANANWTIPIGTIGVFNPVSMVHESTDATYVFRGTINLDSTLAQILSVEYIWFGPSYTGTGSWSLTSVSIPDKPTGLYVTSNATTRVTATWDAPADNGSRITGYVVTSSPGGNFCTTSATLTTAAPTSCVITGLTVGTSYTFTAVATNAIGSSAASMSTTPIVPQIAPIPARAVAPRWPVAVGGVGSAFVSWTAPDSDFGASVRQYEVRSVAWRPGTSGADNYTCRRTTTKCSASTGGGDANSGGVIYDAVTHTCITTALSCTVTDLVDGVRYWFEVRAVTGADTPSGMVGSDDVSTDLIYAGYISVPDPQVPSAPGTVTVASVPADPKGIATPNAVISWTAALDNGSAITSYRVEGFKRAAPSIDAPSVPGAIQTMNTRLLCETVTLSCTIPNLTLNSYYTFAVTAINRVGGTESAHSSMIQAGAASGVVSPSTNLVSFFGSAPVRVRGAIALVPIAATGIVATTPYQGRSLVSWTGLPGGTLMEYQVTSSPGGFTCKSWLTSCTVFNLTDGVNYTFTVTGGQISDSLVTDSFSARIGTVELKNIVMTWRSTAVGTFAAGWSGTADVMVGFGFTLKTKVTSYTGPLDWTLTVLQTESALSSTDLFPGVSWPTFSLVGTVSSANGTISWNVESRLADWSVPIIPTSRRDLDSSTNPDLGYSVFTLSDMTFSIRNVCPTLAGTTAYVCPRGMNSLYLVATLSVVMRLDKPGMSGVEGEVPYNAYTSTGYLVYGLLSKTMTMAVKFPDAVVGSGVTLKGPLLQMYTTMAPPVSMTTIPLIGAPGAPLSVSATSVLRDGTAVVRWITPPNDGGTTILGYTVVATPSAKSTDTAAHPAVTCVVGPGGYTVTREAVKTTADPQKAPKSTKVSSSSTSLNTFCAMKDLDYDTEYTYTVSAFNAVGEGAPGVSTSIGSVSILGALKGAKFFVELSGGLNLTDLGIDISVKMTAVPLGPDGKPLTTENPCQPTSVFSVTSPKAVVCANQKYGWAIIANIASDAGAKKSMLGIDSVGTMAYTTMPATVVLNGIQTDIPAKTFMFGVTMTLTDAMRKVLPGVDTLNGMLVYTPSTKAWSVTVALATGWATKIGAVTLSFLSTTVGVKGVGSVPEALELTEIGSISFANKDGSTTEIRATLGFRVQTSGSVSVGITVTGTAGQPVWPNMFGYKGFDLMTMSMSVGISGTLPELGLVGTVRLPANMMSALGGTAAVKITVGVNLSLSNPCAAFDIVAEDNVSNVVNIASGSLTAKRIMIVVAPFGCTIGAGLAAVVYPEGASVNFTGSFMGVSVAAKLSTITVGTAVTVSGSIAVSAITMGQLKLDAASIEVSMSTAVGARQYFKFSGGATLLGTKASVLAEASYTNGTAAGSVTATVSIANMTVGGFGLKDVYVRFNLDTTNPLSFELAFGAKFPILPGVMLSATGKLTPTQLYLSVNNTINWGSFEAIATGNVYLGTTAGGSTTFTFSVNVSMEVPGNSLLPKLGGSMSVTTDAKGAHYSVTFNTFSYSPFGAFELSLFADCEWAGFPNGAQIGGRISAPFEWGQLWGRVTGIARLGRDNAGKTALLMDITVTANLGVAWAANVGATLHFTNCSASCSKWASPILQLRAQTTWMGNTIDTGWQTMSLDGSFSISSTSSFSRSSGIIYGCVNCSDPGSAGLLRWQASFSGSATFTFSSANGLRVATSAKAQINESASKGTCTKWWGAKGSEICTEYDYSWGSFVKSADVDISIDVNSESLKSSWLGKAFSA